MIVIFSKSWPFSRLKQEVTSGHLKDHACEGPDVGTGSIFGSYYDLRRAVLPCLDFRCKVMVSPTSVTKVTDFKLQVFIKLRPSLLCFLHLQFLLDFHRVNFVQIQTRNSNLPHPWSPFVLRDLYFIHVLL
jgi:hypothetical protein